MNPPNTQTYAPIALFVYNRVDHAHKTIQALSDNLLATQSDLYIFSDAAKIYPNDPIKTEAARKAVEEVRDYISSVSGFNSISITEREHNFGLARSIITGVTDIVNRYGKVIVVEDDLVTSPYFLTYMNDGLNMYEHDEKVASIHGYTYAIKDTLPETFFLRGTDCWGWATWKRAWAGFSPDGNKLLSELQSRNLTREFDFNNSYPFTDMLRGQIAGTNDSWAVRWYASTFLANKLTLYPGTSLVDNIGHDTTGTHSKKTGRYRNAVSNRKIQVERIPLQEDSHVRALFAAYLKPPRPDLFRRVLNRLRSH